MKGDIIFLYAMKVMPLKDLGSNVHPGTIQSISIR